MDRKVEEIEDQAKPVLFEQRLDDLMNVRTIHYNCSFIFDTVDRPECMVIYSVPWISSRLAKEKVLSIGAYNKNEEDTRLRNYPTYWTGSRD